MVDLICCGAINWDINLFTERLPQVGEEISVKEIQRVSGGTAANVSVAAARLLGESRVAFIGALGEDPIAETQIEILDDEGVDFSGVLLVPGEESGQAYITISSEGENEIHTYFGANLKLNGQQMYDPERLELIKSTKMCVIMDPPVEAAAELAKICAENDVVVIWDPGVYADEGFDALMPVLENTDYFILNHVEYENLVGTSDPEKIGSILDDKVKGIKAIIKRGSEGSTLCHEASGVIVQVDSVPLEKLGLKVVNTVGCGDAFIGAFASALVEGKTDIEALREASAAGSFKATRKETRGGPIREELQEIIERWSQL